MAEKTPTCSILSQDVASEPNLKAAQQQAIVALVSGLTVDAAAKEAGVNRSTLHRWLQDDLFRNAYDSARNYAFHDALVEVKSTTQQAVGVLRRLMNKEDTADAVALRAAYHALTIAMHAHESLDVEARINTLQAQCDEAQARNDEYNRNRA